MVNGDRPVNFAQNPGYAGGRKRVHTTTCRSSTYACSLISPPLTYAARQSRALMSCDDMHMHEGRGEHGLAASTGRNVFHPNLRWSDVGRCNCDQLGAWNRFSARHQIDLNLH